MKDLLVADKVPHREMLVGLVIHEGPTSPMAM